MHRLCIACPAGTSCSVGSAEPKPCLPGSFGASPLAESCSLCPASQYQDLSGQPNGVQDLLRRILLQGRIRHSDSLPGRHLWQRDRDLDGRGLQSRETRILGAHGQRAARAVLLGLLLRPGASADNQFGGSKPIIVPVGSSTATEVVAAAPAAAPLMGKWTHISRRIVVDVTERLHVSLNEVSNIQTEVDYCSAAPWPEQGPRV